MNWDLILLVIFYLILFTIFRIFRNKFELQWGIFALYRTKIGLDLMDKIAKKFPRTLNALSYVSVTIGFIGMAITLVFLVIGALSFLSPVPQPQVAPVLPGVSIAGLPKLSFWHWIISILIAATIHEFMHGVYSRLNNVKIKSSGFAFLGPILAAFVEPDEKILNKKGTKAQLSVLSAGPFSNIVLGILILFSMLIVLEPLGHLVVGVQGAEIGTINETFPIITTGIKSGDIITEIDYVKIDDANKFKLALADNKPGDVIKVKTLDKEYDIKLGENPSNKTQPYLGITLNKLQFGPKESLGSNFKWLADLYLWFYLLVFWLFNINLGIGMFNLLPLGPVDGGRMFYSAALHFTNKDRAMKLLKIATITVLFLILINMWPFILKLIKFIFSPLAFLF